MGIRSISTYALGATITATWVSGSGFIMDLTEFYSSGVLHSDLNIVSITIALNAIALIFSSYIIEKLALLKCFGIRNQLKKKKK
jgi:Na+/proline symporter